MIHKLLSKLDSQMDLNSYQDQDLFLICKSKGKLVIEKIWTVTSYHKNMITYIRINIKYNFAYWSNNYKVVALEDLKKYLGARESYFKELAENYERLAEKARVNEICAGNLKDYHVHHFI